MITWCAFSLICAGIWLWVETENMPFQVPVSLAECQRLVTSLSHVCVSRHIRTHTRTAGSTVAYCTRGNPDPLGAASGCDTKTLKQNMAYFGWYITTASDWLRTVSRKSLAPRNDWQWWNASILIQWRKGVSSLCVAVSSCQAGAVTRNWNESRVIDGSAI